MAKEIGPREKQLREQRERRFAENEARNKAMKSQARKPPPPKTRQKKRGR